MKSVAVVVVVMRNRFTFVSFRFVPFNLFVRFVFVSFSSRFVLSSFWSSQTWPRSSFQLLYTCCTLACLDQLCACRTTSWIIACWSLCHFSRGSDRQAHRRDNLNNHREILFAHIIINNCFVLYNISVQILLFRWFCIVFEINLISNLNAQDITSMERQMRQNSNITYTLESTAFGSVPENVLEKVP